MTVHPVKPKHRPDKISLWAYFRAFRRDILSAQPERLYHACMAEFKTPFFRSVMINQQRLFQPHILWGRSLRLRADHGTQGCL